MAKQAALDSLDELIERGTHAALNTDPGVNIVKALEAIRDEVADITEA